MRITCWIPKATDIHLEYVIFLHFDGNNGYAIAPQFSVLRIFSRYMLFRRISGLLMRPRSEEGSVVGHCSAVRKVHVARSVRDVP
jgi:hypothetical protein